MIAMAVMVVGIGFVALLTAYVADRFIRQDVGEEVAGREDQLMTKIDAISERLEGVERSIQGQGAMPSTTDPRGKGS